MKTMKRLLPLLLSVLLVVGIAAAVYAAGGNTNVVMTVDKTEAKPGDIVTVTLSHNTMTVSSFTAGFKFDTDKLECIAINGPMASVDPAYANFYYLTKAGVPAIMATVQATAVSTTEQANANGQVGFAVAATAVATYTGQELFTVQFKVKDGASGDLVFASYEDTAGTDAYKGDGTTETVTIAPACDHEGKTYSYETLNATTHKVICECGETVKEAENHDYTTDRDGYCKYCPQKCYHDNELVTSTDLGNLPNDDSNTHSQWAQCDCGDKFRIGSTNECTVNNADGDCLTAENCECGREMTPAETAHVAGNDDGDCTTAVQCVNCDQNAVAAKNHSFTTKKSDSLAFNADCDDAAQYYVQCDNCNVVSTEKTVSVGEALRHGHTNGFQLVSNHNGTHNVQCIDCGLFTEEGLTCTVDESETCYSEATPATCCEAGNQWKYTCCACSYNFAPELLEGTIPATGEHTLVKDEQAPTCLNYGYMAYWRCESSGFCYEDEDGTIKIEDIVAWLSEGGEGYIAPDKDNHTSTEVTYVNHNNGTHTGYHACCGEPIGEAVPHDYTTGTSAHTCICDAVETYTITFMNGNEVFATMEVPYGAPADFYGTPIPEVPTGHSWDGWYTADGTQVLPGETWDKDVVCYATFKVNSYTLTVYVWATEETVELTVPYGANLLEVLAEAAAEGKIPEIGDLFRVNDEYYNGYNRVEDYSYQDQNGEWIYDLTGLTMPDGDFWVDQDAYFYDGWELYYSDDGEGTETYVGAEFYSEGICLRGWNYIEEDYDDVEGGAWYYFYDGTGEWENYFFRAEGLTRVPYPTAPINGFTYGPDAEAMAYCAANGTTFIDATEAWFYFDENGKFCSDANGMTVISEEDYTNNIVRKLVNGMLAWHPGLIFYGNDYWYFIGDVVNGGNIPANGDTYITKNNGVEAFQIGDIYNFVNGKLSGYNGIVSGKYYVNSRLMTGNGLTKLDNGNFIYVRYDGTVVMNAEYYVPANDLGIVPGMYSFDENGYMVNPNTNLHNGVVDGKYYVNGKIGYGAGLIEWQGNFYYVRSNGQVATGTYWITKANTDVTGYNPGKYEFDATGKMLPVKNGVVDGYYYVNNHIQYGAGLVEYNGELIYVRSNGKIVVSTEYWVTNANTEVTGYASGLYYFDSNGYLYVPAVETLEGIVEVEGVLYFYEDGEVAYGAGLMVYNQQYIYVRSNGQLAVGKYWVTNTNGLCDPCFIEFGEDGYMLGE